ncbi:DUF523 and DUF1722 domain-containing protein [Spirillospora sp. NPDC047279]|uniref:YbgA family protein n=1 Tax=Spirillospora sp. NPDC047279 TaxID=3155478 RepID=UPI0033C4573F
MDLAPLDPVVPRVAVSGCLLGEPVRYNAGHCRSRFLTQNLEPYVEWVSVCPEMEIGLGAPRPSLRLVGREGGDLRLVTRDGSADHTDAMVELADRRAAQLADLDGWVLKSRSPSCGPRGVTRHLENGNPADRRSRGVFAGRIMDALPATPVEEEGRLNDPVLREHFVERIFAQARLRALFEGGWKGRDLVAFHSAHKLQILAHDPARYRLLGRVVAAAGARPPDELRAEYTDLFAAAFAVRPKRGRHVNALQHVFGPMSERLDDARRHDITGIIDAYARGEVPLQVPMTLLRHHARGEDIAYLQAQTYFQPYPADLPIGA